MRLKNEGQIRLYILTLMQYADCPLRYPQINDIVVQDGFVTNFDFILQFDELLATGLVRKKDGDTYEITSQGAFVAKTLQSEIAGYVRERGIKNAMQLLAFEKSGIKAKVEKTARDGGGVDLTLRILRRGDEIISVKLATETDYQAQRMEQNFLDNPEHIYKFIYSFLIGDNRF